MPTITSYCNIINRHNCLGRVLSAVKFVQFYCYATCRDSPRGCPISASPIQGHSNCKLLIIGLLPSRPTIIKLFTLSAFRHFLFIWKRKRLQKKSKTGGIPLYPRQRRAAVHSLRLSVSCSAHSHANAPELERMRARASCFASRFLARLRSLTFTLLQLEW